MKKKLLALGVAGAVLASAGYIGAQQVSAHSTNTNSQGYRAHYSPERHAQMEQILENQNYEEWLELVGDKPITNYVTEENFSTFLEMMALRHEGNFEEADALRAELGLPQRGTHRGEGYGEGNGMRKGQGYMRGQGRGLHLDS
ncbi:MAG: hypothetical protein OEX81_05450 [Candidatus Pacebacteria bacterium]|nr:hypothetical protein [Candidatus Paceibacterota bacterium]